MANETWICLSQSDLWKIVCDRRCATKLCVKDCMWRSVCERGWWVWSGRQEDGVWQRCAWENCWQRLYERWCVTTLWDRWCVTKKMVCDRRCDKDVCVRLCHACHVKRTSMSPCATPAAQNEGGCEILWDCATPATWNARWCHQVPRLPHKVPRRHGRLKPAQARHPVPWVPGLPRKTKVDVRLCHTCHVKRTSMSPSATPATQSAAASRAPKTSPSAPPSAMSATPATRNDGGCEICATPATWNARRCHQVPRLPRKVPRRHGRLNPAQARRHMCHACHAKRRWMWDCATAATWNARRCHQVPHLPRKVPRRHGRLKPAQARHPVPWVPRLPRKTKVDVRLCHTCHVKRASMSPSATPATQSAAASRAPKTSPSAPPSAMSATPATRNDGGCEIVPRLPRETHVDVTLCHACRAKRRWMWDIVRLCHACHVKRTSMSPSATPAATQSAAASRAPKTSPSAPPSAISATPATKNESGCESVPRQPRDTNARRCHLVTTPATQSVISATPATQNEGGCESVPRLPRKTKVDVTLCHACHAKCRYMWQMVCDKVLLSLCVKLLYVWQCVRWYVTKVVCEVMYVKDNVEDGMWRRCVWSHVCDRWYVTKLCVKCMYVTMWQMVCDKVVC